jgi:biopolymer transport protein TolR
MRTQSVPSIQAAPNVTPMIDVMLVLLVIFMVTAPSLLSGVQAVPPTADHATAHPTEEGDQILAIDSRGSLFLNAQPIKRDALPAALASIYVKRKLDRVLYLRADKRTRYALVIDAIDVAAKNGVAVVGMISEQRPAIYRRLQSAADITPP